MSLNSNVFAQLQPPDEPDIIGPYQKMAALQTMQLQQANLASEVQGRQQSQRAAAMSQQQQQAAQRIVTEHMSGGGELDDSLVKKLYGAGLTPYAEELQKSITGRLTADTSRKNVESEIKTRENDLVLRQGTLDETRAKNAFDQIQAKKPKPFEAAPNAQYGQIDPDTARVTIQGTVPAAPVLPPAGTLPLTAERYQQELNLRGASKADDPGIELTQAGVDAAAIAYAKTNQLPPMGMGKQVAAVRAKIINRAAEMFPGLDLASAQAGFNADKGSLSSLQKNRDAVVSFENTASKNLDNFLATVQKVVDTGSPWVNQPIRLVQQRGLGNEDLIAFNAARRVAINEIAKVTSNPALVGQLSDSARREVEAFIPQDATLKQILAVAKILKQDMKSRHDSLDEQIAAIKGRIKDGEAKPSTVRMIAPNGDESDIPADQVEHFKQRGAKVK